MQYYVYFIIILVLLFAVVDCGPLTTDSNALGSLTVSFTTTVYLSTAVYTCPDVGYVLIGADTRICRETGAWVDDPPHCDSKFVNFPYALTLNHVKTLPFC